MIWTNFGNVNIGVKWLQSHPYCIQTKVDAFQSELNKILSVSNVVWLAGENHSILTCLKGMF